MKEMVIVFIIVGIGFLVVRRIANTFYYHENIKNYMDKKYDYSSIDESEDKK